MISEVMRVAIEHLRHKTSFGELDIKVLSEKEYRQPPSEFCALGYLGVDVEIEGIKAFLGNESVAENILWYGNTVADEVICSILKPVK